MNAPASKKGNLSPNAASKMLTPNIRNNSRGSSNSKGGSISPNRSLSPQTGNNRNAWGRGKSANSDNGPKKFLRKSSGSGVSVPKKEEEKKS